MPKIKNPNLAGQYVVTAYGNIKFDHNGIGEVSHEELYQALLKIYGFEPVVEEEPKAEEKPAEVLVEEEKKKVVEVEEFTETTSRRFKKKKEEPTEDKE